MAEPEAYTPGYYRHKCNALCVGQRHADVLWARSPVDFDSVAVDLLLGQGMKLLELSEAPEAPEVGPDGRSRRYRYLIVIEPVSWLLGG